jgi:hypothetical protein
MSIHVFLLFVGCLGISISEVLRNFQRSSADNRPLQNPPEWGSSALLARRDGPGHRSPAAKFIKLAPFYKNTTAR